MSQNQPKIAYTDKDESTMSNFLTEQNTVFKLYSSFSSNNPEEKQRNKKKLSQITPCLTINAVTSPGLGYKFI